MALERTGLNFASSRAHPAPAAQRWRSAGQNRSMQRALLLFLATLQIMACGVARRAEEISPVELQALARHQWTLDHVAYLGSDHEFHYFAHSQNKGGGYYKVARARLSLDNDFPLESQPARRYPAEGATSRRHG